MQIKNRWLMLGMGAALLLSACTKEEAKPYENAVAPSGSEAGQSADSAANSQELTLPPGLGGPSQAAKVGELEGAGTAGVLSNDGAKFNSGTFKNNRGTHKKKQLARAARKHRRKH